MSTPQPLPLVDSIVLGRFSEHNEYELEFEGILNRRLCENIRLRIARSVPTNLKGLYYHGYNERLKLSRTKALWGVPSK